jgi:23S rRNA (cytosine1962-C5)-methyltransferase
MVTWARENAQLNQLETSSIRWIVDDVQKFLTREIKRGSRYDAIILDPPSFGRGAKGELFKIEEDIIPLLNDCKVLLSEQPLFMLFSCHTPGFSPLVMQHLLTQTMQEYPGYLDVGEMILTGYQNTVSVPSGTYARWIAEV